MSNQISSLSLHNREQPMKCNHARIGNLYVFPALECNKDTAAKDAASLRPNKESVHMCSSQERWRTVVQQRVQSKSDGVLKVSEAPRSFCSSDTRQWSDKWLSGSRASGVFWDVSYLAGASQTHAMSPACVPAGFLSERLSFRHLGGHNCSPAHFIGRLFEPKPVSHH